MLTQEIASSTNRWVVLPTYCESENLAMMIGRLLALDLDLDILVVDDNSPDGTGEIAESLGEKSSRVHLLRRIDERGLGSAYLAGFRHALNVDADIVITMDSDLSHEPEALPSLIVALENVGCVVGSRYVEGGSIENWPKRRRLLSAAANRFVRALFAMPIADCTSGYRLYRRQVVRDILGAEPRSQGYSFLVEVLRIAANGPLAVAESPIRFVERTAGNSKMGGREIFWGAWTLLRLRASLLVGRTRDAYCERSGRGVKADRPL